MCPEEENGASPTDGWAERGSVDPEIDGIIRVWIRCAPSIPKIVRAHTAGQEDQYFEPATHRIDDAKGLGLCHLFYAKEFVAPGGIISFYHGDSHILLDGHNPQRIGGGAASEVAGQSGPADEGNKQRSETAGVGMMDRDQIQDMIAASESRAEAKFERLVGEVRLIAADVHAEMAVVRNQTSGMKGTIVITGITLFLGLGALLIGMMTYGDSVFGRGMSVRDVVMSTTADQQKSLSNAIEAAVRQAMRERDGAAAKP